MTKAVENQALRKKLEQDLSAVRQEYREKSAHLDSLEEALRKEKVDVDRLERTSLTSLFYSVLGSREQQMEKERQELLSAELLYQRTKFEVDSLEQEKDSLQQKLAGLAGVDAEVERLLDEKEQALRQSNQAAARQLIELAEQMAQANGQVKEQDEAIRAGNEALSGLNKVLDSLQSAERWGVWDTLGGDLLSTAIKHSRIDDAREEIQEVQVRMSRFQRELADVNRSVDLQIDISGFATFADYFFDGLIADWVVQSKIEKSLEQARQAEKTIQDAVNRVEALKRNSSDKIKSLEEQREQLIRHS